MKTVNNFLSNGYESINNLFNNINEVKSAPIINQAKVPILDQTTTTIANQTTTSVLDQTEKLITDSIGISPSELASKTATFFKNIETSLGSIGFSRKAISNKLTEKYNHFRNVTHSTENFKLALNEFRKDSSEWVENASNATSLQFESIKADFQKFLEERTLESGLKIAPWIILGTSITIGAPIFTYYAYKKVKNHLRSPNLVSESKKIGFYSQSKESLSNTVSALWNTLKPGLIYGTTTMVLGFFATKAAENAGNILPSGQHLLTSEESLKVIGLVQITSLGIAAIAMIFKASSLIYHTIKSNVTEPKPVFYTELDNTIENILNKTQNLLIHGGYFENILLYGSPGTGKTMTAKYMAKNLDMNYIKISGKDLVQNIAGRRVSELENIFQTAKNASLPTIIFIDDADALFNHSDTITGSDLIKLQNILFDHTKKLSNKMMLIMATSSEKILAPALLNNMDHKLSLDLPNLSTRKALVEKYLPNFFSENEIKEVFTNEILEMIASKTLGLTGHDMIKMMDGILSSRKASLQNKLTTEMVLNSVQRFVEKEKGRL